MRSSRRHFLTLFAAAPLALSGSVGNSQLTRQQFYAMGTEADIMLVGRPEQAQVALMACREEIKAIENTFSLYNPDSMLSQLNLHGHVATDDRFSTLLHQALYMAQQTSGAFDPTIQPLWRAVAAGKDLARANQQVGWRGLIAGPGTAHFEHTGMAASFNGIAQGFAADQVQAILEQNGFRDTLVNLGEFAAQGVKPNGPWRLGIRSPLSGRIVTRIEDVAGAIATSEPRATLVAGRSHIFDPLERSGERWASVTVEAAQAWRADALSTAIAASPVGMADNLLGAGAATRAWLINSADTLREWHAA